MRVLATFTGAFSAGIFLAQYLLPADWLLPCAVFAFLASFGKVFFKGNLGRHILLIGVGLSLAFGYNWLYVRQVQRPMDALAGTQQTVEMTLYDYAVETNYGAKAVVRINGLPGKVVYYGDTELLELRPGMVVTDTVSFQSASHIRDDDITTFTSKGVFLLAYQKGESVFQGGSMESLRWWPLRIGHAMQEKIQELFHGDVAGFLTAVLTGDKTMLSVEGAADLSEAGLYHILAVSGMHCGFLLTMVIALTGRHRRRLTAGAMLVLLAFYALLTGGSPSVVRACIMLMFYLTGPIFQRESDGPTALAAALFLILLANPFAAASVSLQLSFGAMAGILWLTPKLYRILKGSKKHERGFYFLISGFSATMGALVFTVPLLAYYFGTLVLISPISNLLCLWAASLVFIFGLAAVVIGFLCPPLGIAAAFFPRLLAKYILLAAHLMAEVPYHAVSFSNPYLKFWLAFAYLLFMTAWMQKPKTVRKYAFATVLAVVTLAVTVVLGQARYRSDLDVIVLDVGQGQSILFASGGEFALIDCGSANSWYGAGELAARQLQTMGCGALNYLVLTHYDSDHISGVRDLLARMDVEMLLIPWEADDVFVRNEIFSLAEERHVEVEFVGKEENLRLGRAEMTVFPPVGTASDNNRCLSVLASVGGEELLVTGDMNTVTEKKLLAEHPLPDIEYLVAGHHGAVSSTSEELLSALKPETVCISVGSNSYGHPAEKTLQRLTDHGCAIYRTDLHGNIHLSLNQGE